MVRTQQEQQNKTNKHNHEIKGDDRDEKQNNSTNKGNTQNKGTIRRQRKDKNTKTQCKKQKEQSCLIRTSPLAYL